MVLWIRNSLSESKGNLFFATLKANILFMLQMLAKASLV